MLSSAYSVDIELKYLTENLQYFRNFLLKEFVRGSTTSIPISHPAVMKLQEHETFPSLGISLCDGRNEVRLAG